MEIYCRPGAEIQIGHRISLLLVERRDERSDEPSVFQPSRDQAPIRGHPVTGTRISANNLLSAPCVRENPNDTLFRQCSFHSIYRTFGSSRSMAIPLSS